MLKYAAAFAALALVIPAAAQDAQPPGDPAALLSEATTALGNGEIAAARRAAEKAGAALAIKHGEAIRATLPAPFDGWTVNDEDTAHLGMIALGGGIAVNRTYSSPEGTDVRIEVLADSDMVAQMAQMFTDPQMSAAMGLKSETIAGETAYINPNDGQITFVIDGRTTITLTGSADAAVRKSYAENIRFPEFRAIK